MASRPIIPTAAPSLTSSMRMVSSTSSRPSRSSNRRSAPAPDSQMPRGHGSHNAEASSSTDPLPLPAAVSPPSPASPPWTSTMQPSAHVAPLTLSVSGSEQVLVDPQNRDAVLRPRRGDALPDAHNMCTAFTVDVFRPSDGLSFSIPVRFSRFERLQSELLRELPELRGRLPPLPAKRGPLDKLFTFGAPPDPQAVEARTRQLHAYLQQLIQLPRVAESAAVRDLLAMSAPAEAAIRQAREEAASHDEARQTQMSELARELTLSSSYARTLRSAKDRAESRLTSLHSSLEASAGFIDRQRSRHLLAAAWRRWDATTRRAREARADKALAAAAASLRAQSAELSDARAALEQSAAALRASHAQRRAAAAALDAERAAHAAALRRHEEAARAAHASLAADRDGALARADAAAQAASAAHAQLRAAAAEASGHAAATRVLAAALEETEREVARLGEALSDATAAGGALQSQLASERRRRVLSALRASLEQRAGEARLLLLLHSQRERIEATSRELAAARRAAAVARAEPALEAPWLAPPPEMAPPAEEPPPIAVDAHAIDLWKRDWMTAMAHCL
ncbi:hypothetical protein AB1Y20_012997 [Prymnesium parvum]|uniref:PX domain-containing protein n=1 Tax=Prymnesium parvum TaxID=97485 RepID=A0AB34IKF0_PRYPA